ncbi:MAG: hypothetical protein WC650_00595 [Candidatus Doudnabacteria bacterium]
MRITLTCLMVLIVLLMSGCDQVRNPFEGIDISDIKEVQSAPPVTMELVVPDYMKYSDVKLAPAAASSISIDSNLFEGANYPEGTKTLEITGGRLSTNVYTVITGWMRIYYRNGSTIYNIKVKGSADSGYTEFNQVDKNGAFLLRFTPDGHVQKVPIDSPTNIKELKFALRAQEKNTARVELSSDKAGLDQLSMDLNQSTRDSAVKEWNLNIMYPENGRLRIIVYSQLREAYTYTVYANGVELWHLVQADGKWYFEFSLTNGVVTNTGADNRKISVNIG